MLINQPDKFGLTPFFLLCKKKFEHGAPNPRADIARLLLEGKKVGSDDSLIEGSLKRSNLAEWHMQCEQIGFSPLHWLAFWDDGDSIQIVLQNYASKIQKHERRCCSEKKNKAEPLCWDFNGYSALDVAGRNNSKKAAETFL